MKVRRGNWHDNAVAAKVFSLVIKKEKTVSNRTISNKKWMPLENVLI